MISKNKIPHTCQTSANSKKKTLHLSNIRDPREKTTLHLTNIRDLKLFSREKFTRKNGKKIRESFVKGVPERSIAILLAVDRISREPNVILIGLDELMTDTDQIAIKTNLVHLAKK